MTTITIPKKEYQQLVKQQVQIADQVAFLSQIVERLAKDELQPAYVKKIERQSAAFDSGKGRRFASLKQFRSYLAAL